MFSCGVRLSTGCLRITLASLAYHKSRRIPNSVIDMARTITQMDGLQISLDEEVTVFFDTVGI